MRLDQFLKLSCLVKRRTLIPELCQKNLIRINGSSVKPAKVVRIGDILDLEFPYKRMKIRIVSLPEGKQVSKSKAQELYEVLVEEKFSGVDSVIHSNP